MCRHHVYEKRGGPKSIELKEVGPRFELRLYQVTGCLVHFALLLDLFSGIVVKRYALLLGETSFAFWYYKFTLCLVT